MTHAVLHALYQMVLGCGSPEDAQAQLRSWAGASAVGIAAHLGLDEALTRLDDGLTAGEAAFLNALAAAEHAPRAEVASSGTDLAPWGFGLGITDVACPQRAGDPALAITSTCGANARCTLLFAGFADPEARRSVLERADALCADLERVLGLACEVALVREAAQILADVLALEAEPAFLLHPDGTVQHMNTPAREATRLRQRMYLTPSNGLRLTLTPESQELLAAIRDAAESPGAAVRVVSVPPSPDQSDGFEVALRLAASRPRPLVRATVRHRHRALSLSKEFVAQAFQLTPIESELVLAIGNSESPQEFAAARGRKASTMHWHLQNIFRKMRVSGQDQMIRLLIRLDTP